MYTWFAVSFQKFIFNENLDIFSAKLVADNYGFCCKILSTPKELGKFLLPLTAMVFIT